MNIYIIATVKSNNKTHSFVLLDIDDNNKTITVTKEQLVNVLKQKKLKINNAKLHNNSVQGTYYSLDVLPNNIKILEHSIQVLYTTSEGKAKIVCINKLGVIKVLDILISDLAKAVHSGSVVNIDKYGNILCKKINIAKNDIDSEALDENKIWTLQDFANYMRIKGWTYKLHQSNINKYEYILEDVSEDCNILHLPIGVSDVQRFYNNTPKNKIIKLIISPTVHTIKEFVHTDDLIDIGDIIFQKNNSLRKFNISNMQGLHNLNILGKATLPDNALNIDSIYEKCIIHNKINLDTDAFIRYSFRETVFNQDILNINCCKIINSFDKIEGIEKIIIGNKVSTLNSCINNSEITEINFSNAECLDTISNSFKKLDLTNVNLSNCKKLTRISSKSFTSNKNLKEIIFSDTIEDISYGIACNTKIDEVMLPRNIKSFSWDSFNEESKIILPNTITEIGTKLLYNYDGQLMESLDNTAKILKSQSFINNNSYGFVCNLPSSLSIFEDSAFEKSKITSFDSARFKELKQIPSKCFFNCTELKYIILDDNINSIKGQAFRGCSNVEVIILGPNITDFSSTAFSSSNFVKSPLCYVIKGTKAHKEMQKINIAIIEVGSVQEARDIVFNSRKTDKEKEAKFSMMLASTKYRILLEEPYVKDISFAYKFIHNMEEDNMRVGDRLILDTSKYINLDIDLIPVVKNLNVFKRVNKHVDEVTDINECYKFIAFSNFITKLFDIYPAFNSEDKLNKIIGSGFLNTLFVFYSNGDRNILLLRLDGIRDEFFERSSGAFKIDLLILTIGNNIKFVTEFDYDYYSEMTINECSLGNSLISKEHKFNIGAYLNKGDIISGDRIIINNALIHPSYANSIMKHIIKSSVSLYNECVNEKNKIYKSLIYDLNNQRFLLINYGLKAPNNITVLSTTIKSIVILETYDMQQIYNTDIMKKFLNINKNENYRLLLNNFLLDRSEKQLIIDDINNYDIDGNIEMQELADKIYSKNIFNLEDLDSDIITSIIKTEFFMKSEYSLNDMSNSTRYKVDIVKQLDNNLVLLTYKTELHTSNKFFFTSVVSPITSMNKKGTILLSRVPLQEIVKCLYTIGQYRATSLGLPYCKISNNKINIDNFYCLKTIHSDSFSTDGIKLLLAVDKLNCDSYLLGEWLDTDFYTILRFKNMTQALKFLEKLIRTDRSDFREDCVKIVSSLRINSSYMPDNIIQKCRSDIMSGVPNNYCFKSRYNGVFNMLARQPKI